MEQKLQWHQFFEIYESASEDTLLWLIKNLEAVASSEEFVEVITSIVGNDAAELLIELAIKNQLQLSPENLIELCGYIDEHIVITKLLSLAKGELSFENLIELIDYADEKSVLKLMFNCKTISEENLMEVCGAIGDEKDITNMMLAVRGGIKFENLMELYNYAEESAVENLILKEIENDITLLNDETFSEISDNLSEKAFAKIAKIIPLTLANQKILVEKSDYFDQFSSTILVLRLAGTKPLHTQCFTAFLDVVYKEDLEDALRIAKKATNNKAIKILNEEFAVYIEDDILQIPPIARMLGTIMLVDCYFDYLEGKNNNKG